MTEHNFSHNNLINFGQLPVKPLQCSSPHFLKNFLVNQLQINAKRIVSENHSHNAFNIIANNKNTEM